MLNQFGLMPCSILVLLLSTTALTGCSRKDDREIIAELNRKWIASYATRDTTTIQRVLADDFIMISPKGVKLDKHEVMSMIASTEVETAATIDSTRITMFGDIALLVGYIHFTQKSSAVTLHGSNVYSDMYVKRNGKWQAVSAHVTLLDISPMK